MNKYRFYIPSWAGCVYGYGSSMDDAKKNFKRIHGMERMPRGHKVFLETD